MRKRFHLFLLLGLVPVLLSACIGSMLSKQTRPEIKEQLYVDARLNFTIKHPLAWQLQEIPVSSPAYQADTVKWRIEDSTRKNGKSGEMLIRSTPAVPKNTLPELLASYLSILPDHMEGKQEAFTLPAGKALEFTGQDATRGRMTIVIKGRRRDFIISLEAPSARFNELLPLFQDVVSSFVEIIPPKP